MRRISSLYSDEWTLPSWMCHPTLLFWNRVAWWEESHCLTAIGGHCLLDCVTHSVVLKSSCLMRRVSLCYGDWWTLPSWLCHSLCCSEIELPDEKSLTVDYGDEWTLPPWLCHSLCCSEIELPEEKSLIVLWRLVDTTFVTVPPTLLFWNRVAWWEESYRCTALSDWWTLPSWLCHSLCCSDGVAWWEESHCVMAIGGHCLLDCVTHSLKSSCLMRRVSHGDEWTLPSWLCPRLCCSEIELPDEKSLIVLWRLVDTAFLTVSLTLLVWNRVAWWEESHCVMAIGGHYLLDCVTHSVVLKSSSLMRRISSSVQRWVDTTLRDCAPDSVGSEIEFPNAKDLIVVQRWVDTTFVTVPPTLLVWNGVAWWEESHRCTAMSGHCLLDCATNSAVLKSSCRMRRVSSCDREEETPDRWMCNFRCRSEIEFPDAMDLIITRRWVDTASLTVSPTRLFWNRGLAKESFLHASLVLWYTRFTNVLRRAMYWYCF